MRRIQFSLATLMLGVLFAASGVLTWWNCEPWKPAFTIPVSFADERVFYSNDDKFLCAIEHYGRPAPDDLNVRQSFKANLYDAQSGRLAYAFRTAELSMSEPDWHCENGYFYIIAVPEAEEPTEFNAHLSLPCRLCGMWRLDTGEDFLKSHPELGAMQFFDLFHNGEYAVIQDKRPTCRVVRFPSLDEICATNLFAASVCSSPDNDTVALNGSNSIVLVSLKKRAILAALSTHSEPVKMNFSDDGTKFGFSDKQMNPSTGVANTNYTIYIVDLNTPAKVKEFLSDTGTFHFACGGARVVYSWYSPVQLRLYDLTMDSSNLLESSHSAASTWIRNDILYSIPTPKAWDTRTAKRLNQKEQPLFVRGYPTENPNYVLVGGPGGNKDGSLRIIDVAADKNSGTLRASRWPKQFPNGIKQIAFAHCLDSFITSPYVLFDGSAAPGAGIVHTVWTHGVPNEWWGCLTMWEFWLTAAIGIALLWNIIRRWRRA